MKHFLVEGMERFGDDLAVATPAGVCGYRELLSQLADWRGRIEQAQVPAGAVVSLEGEYGVPSIAALLALMLNRNIIVPLSPDARAQAREFRAVAEVEYRVRLHSEPVEIAATGQQAGHPLYARLREQSRPGLVLFTSGSTGKSKAAVHDLEALTDKYRARRQRLRTIVFLQLDHIGGINTLFYTLSNGGAVVVPADRSPAAVCQAIETHRAELLPTSPTFLNLLLLSEEHRRRDLSSLTLITYGTEPMPPSTLERMAAVFPDLKLQQTYGMTELGILRSKSRDSRSLWVRVGGDGFETKVKDGRLWVKAHSAMLGYLNAPSPFDEEGFLDTGDEVEVDGEWLRILGRKSEIINVGGQKVYPAAVESVLLEIPEVADAVVRGEPHPITGRIVTATVRLRQPLPPREFKARMRQFCKDRLPTFAIPVKVQVEEHALHSERYKRVRRADPATPMPMPPAPEAEPVS